MTPEQSLDVVALLEESRIIFEAAMDDIAADRAADKAHPERWSAIEIIEHVTVAERAMLGQLMRSDLADEGERNPAREIEIHTKIRGRLSRVQAPEAAHPRGRFESLDVARRQFAVARAQTIQFACDRLNELPRLSGQHMRFGPVNGVEMLAIIAAHSCRHAEQLRETL